MTETELTDQLREAIVLDGPDVWRTNGYLQDAQNVGLSLPDALKRAAEVSQDVETNAILFQNIRTRIARLAQPSRSHLFDQDVNQIINAARSLHLTPDFVRTRWIPAELAKIAPKPAPTAPKPAQPITSPAPTPANIPSEPPTTTPADIYEDLIEPESPPPVYVERAAAAPTPPPVELPKPPAPPEPAYVPVSRIDSPPPVVRMFTATPARVRKGDTVTLEWDVENLLAVTIDDLGEGLSPQNRGWVKPSKTTDYTLFDANNNPLSTVRVDVVQRDRSGVYGVLFALALLALIYWFIKTNTARTEPTPPRPHQTSERPTETSSAAIRSEPAPQSQPTETVPEPTEEPVTESSADTPINDELVQKTPTSPAETAPELDERPSTPADARAGTYEESFGDKPYDKVEVGTDEQGWRRARSKGKWGYINQNDTWVIEPTFEAVTPFRGNMARVFQNGQLVTINRAGEPVSN